MGQVAAYSSYHCVVVVASYSDSWDKLMAGGMSLDDATKKEKKSKEKIFISSQLFLALLLFFLLCAGMSRNNL